MNTFILEEHDRRELIILYTFNIVMFVKICEVTS